MGTYLRFYTPSGAFLGDLNHFLSCTTLQEFLQVGSFNLSVPKNAPATALLDADDAIVVACENGVEQDDYYLLEDDGDDPAGEGGRSGSLIAATGRGYVSILERAIVMPTDLLVVDSETDRVFSQRTTGYIMNTLLTEAQQRGVLPGLTWTFNATVDSNGAPWTDSRTVVIPAGKNLLELIVELGESGYADWRTVKRELRMFLPRTVMGQDRQSLLMLGVHVTNGPRKRSRRNIRTHILGIGDNDMHVLVSDASAAARWGRREALDARGNVAQQSTLTTLAQASLGLYKGVAEGVTLVYVAEDSQRFPPPLPGVDYTLGDFIRYDQRRASSTEYEPLRVQTIAREYARVTEPVVSVELNDVFTESDIALRRRIDRILGTGVSDSPLPVPPASSLPPSAPTGLVVSGEPYTTQVGSATVTRVAATMTWGAPTTNTDGTTLYDLRRYQPQYRLNADGEPWQEMSGDQSLPSATAGPLLPGRSYQFRVRALDAEFNAGPWSTTKTQLMSADTTPPPRPSLPIVSSRLGTVRVKWDGKDLNSAAMPFDFDSVGVFVSDADGFTPSDATYVGSLYEPGASLVLGGFPYSATRWVRLVAYDNVVPPNASAPTPTVSFLVAQIDGDDIEARTIRTNHLEVGAVDAEIIALGTYATNLVADPSFEDKYLIEASTPETLHRWRVSANTTAGSAPTRVAASRSGAYGLSLHCLTTSDRSEVQSNVVPVTPGEKYVATVNVAKTAAAAASFSMRVFGGVAREDTFSWVPFEGEDPNFVELVDVIYTGTPIPDPQLFQAFSAQFTVPPGMFFLDLRIGTYANTTPVVADDVSLIRLGEGATELTSAGLRLFGPEGTEVAATVSNRPNIYSVIRDGQTLASMDDEGAITGQDLVIAQDPEITGRPLLGKYGASLFEIVEFAGGAPYDRDLEVEPIGLMEQYAKGTVAWAQASGDDFPATIFDGYSYGLVELGFDLEPGRQYEVSTSPIMVVAGGAGTVGLRVHFTNNGSIPSLASSYFAYDFKQVRTGGLESVALPSRLYNGGVSTATQLRMLFAVYVLGANGSIYDSQSMTFVIKDLGPVKVPTGTIRNFRNGGPSPDPAPSTQSTRTYTKIYNATGFGTYRGSGSKRTDTTDIVQGYNSYNGDGRGLWTFPSMTADLAGATLSKVEVFCTNSTWYSFAGGTALLKVHGHTSVPGSSPNLITATSSGSWKRGEGRWVTIPSGFYSGFKSGLYRGFGLGPAGTQSGTYYGRFRGGAGSAKIRVTYRK